MMLTAVVVPMTPAEFRKLALRLPQATESSHMDHPDFRVADKIFATLGYPDRRSGMVKLTAAQQVRAMAAHPRMFSRAAGAWGRRGSTIVTLPQATLAPLRAALRQAWENSAPKKLLASTARAE
jgi:hypothetical protein